MSNLMEAKGLLKSYNGREVVKNIDLTIHKGEVVALIGTNGAGKSTTMAMLLGILEPDAGSVEYWRKDYKPFIGVQLQATPFFEGYTAEENLQIFAALYGMKLSKSQISQKLDECKLTDSKKTPAIRLSLGQQKRLAIAVTTVHNPELIVLDEPTSGLDPRARHEIRQMIQTLSQNNVTVLFSSHDMEEVSKVANRIILMHNGKIVAEGAPEALLQKYDSENLEAMYLMLTDNL